jgi:TatA/E family protein of Tat protein translocase
MTPLLAFTAPGWPEILFILLIILVLFGAKRLPELAKGLGQSLNEFKKARDEFDREVKKTAVSLEAKEAPDKEPHKPA